MSHNLQNETTSHSSRVAFLQGLQSTIDQFETRPKSYGWRAAIKAVTSELGTHLNNSANINTNTKRKEAKMSQTYKHLSKLTKSELIQIIKDSDYTINVLTKQLKGRS